MVEGTGEQKNGVTFANNADNCLYECNAGSHIQCRLSVEPDSCIRLYPVHELSIARVSMNDLLILGVDDFTVGQVACRQ